MSMLKFRSDVYDIRMDGQTNALFVVSRETQVKINSHQVFTTGISLISFFIIKIKVFTIKFDLAWMSNLLSFI